MTNEELKAKILELSAEYSRRVHAANRPGNDPLQQTFVAGQTTVPYAGRVFQEQEVVAAVDATLDFWLTLGKEGEAFQKELAEFLSVKYSLLVNSGSSANLIAFATLTSHKLPANRRLLPGDEVITVAAGFPTTVTPIVQHGCVPVFIDANTVTGNADTSLLEQAYKPGKTKAVMMAHALGNPFDLAEVLAFCQKHELWLIEDNCDALGCTYSLSVEKAQQLGLNHLLAQAQKNAESDTDKGKVPFIANDILTAYTGSFGDISTQSFYPPHHLTLGEGGAVNIIKRASLKSVAESFRDWGRDCWCASGIDNTCNKRFGWQLGDLPQGYDHKYIYSHLGYNLKPLDTQAAIGRVQLQRLPAFIEARKRNWQHLRKGLAHLEDFFEFALPCGALAWHEDGSFLWKDGHVEPMLSLDDSGKVEQAPHGEQSSASWFGFKISVKQAAPFTRTELTEYLDQCKIGNRMLFGGNLVRQPAFVQLLKDNPEALRCVGDLAQSDSIMQHTLFIGTYPGLSGAMLDYMVECIDKFVKEKLSAINA